MIIGHLGPDYQRRKAVIDDGIDIFRFAVPDLFNAIPPPAAKEMVVPIQHADRARSLSLRGSLAIFVAVACMLPLLNCC